MANARGFDTHEGIGWSEGRQRHFLEGQRPAGLKQTDGFHRFSKGRLTEHLPELRIEAPAKRPGHFQAAFRQFSRTCRALFWQEIFCCQSPAEGDTLKQLR